MTLSLTILACLAAGLGAVVLAGWWFWYPPLPDEPEEE